VIPLVSIAIPTFDRFAYLKEAVTSALAQTYEAVEVLIGDDGNNAELADWAMAMSRLDSRVFYQKNVRNLGLAGNWNSLADAARGEFIVIIGDDDRLLPDFVATLFKAIQPDREVAFSNHYLIDQHGTRLEAETLAHTQLYHRDLLPAGDLVEPERWVWQNTIPISAALIRTQTVRELRFQEDLNTPEIEFFLRLVQSGGRFTFVPEYLMEYRVHPASATSKGLWSERLAERLLNLPTDPQTEVYRRQFMSPLLVNAVSRCLLQGDPQRAQRFLASGYYPHPSWRHARSLVQTVCAKLPPTVGCSLYRLLCTTRRKWGR
jgi:glycosyltransferase involved in cell wall biosynthesis